MPKYILKRIVGTIPTLIIVVTFVFFFVRLIPGDPARLVAGEQATQDDVEAVREELGLNKSIPTQYVTYVTGLLKGNLGTSLRTKQPVTKEVAGRFGNTRDRNRHSGIILPFSPVSSGPHTKEHTHNRTPQQCDKCQTNGISLPSFWIGFLLIMLFAVKLRILPTTSGTSLKSLIMPSITLGVGIAAVIARFTRSSIIEVLKEDYVRTARAKGIKEKVVIWKHAFRNSMISVVTVVGLQFGFLLGGSVVTETVFAYPGLGSLLIESVNYRDYPAIQSLILIFSLQFIVINLIVDILYAVLNPEIKLQ